MYIYIYNYIYIHIYIYIYLYVYKQPEAAVEKKEKLSEDDLDPTAYYENRLKMLKDMEASGVQIYPHKFNVRQPPLYNEYIVNTLL